eukprot:355198-Chlamydomonas_euryale.AAC.3
MTIHRVSAHSASSRRAIGWCVGVWYCRRLFWGGAARGGMGEEQSKSAQSHAPHISRSGLKAVRVWAPTQSALFIPWQHASSKQERHTPASEQPMACPACAHSISMGCA